VIQGCIVYGAKEVGVIQGCIVYGAKEVKCVYVNSVSRV
jgi:hypothetical protein